MQSSLDLISLNRAQSSANNQAAECKLSLRHLHTQETKKGPNMDACGTLDDTEDHSDDWPPTTTLCCRLDRKDSIQVNKSPQIPWSSFRDNLLCVTISKALEKSRKITCVDEYILRDLAH